MIIILIQTPGLFAEEENKTHRGYVVGSRSSSEPLSPWPRGSSEWAGGDLPSSFQLVIYRKLESSFTSQSLLEIMHLL